MVVLGVEVPGWLNTAFGLGFMLSLAAPVKALKKCFAVLGSNWYFMVGRLLSLQPSESFLVNEPGLANSSKSARVTSVAMEACCWLLVDKVGHSLLFDISRTLDISSVSFLFLCFSSSLFSLASLALSLRI